MISYTFDLPDLPGALRRALPTQRDMQDLAMNARQTIKDRTAKGIAADGTDFQQYSPSYFLAKDRSGRNPSPVNLTYDNTMLGSVSIRDIPNGTELYFASAEMQIRAMRHHFGTEGMPRRPFFAINESEFNTLMQAMMNKIRGRA